MTQTTPYQHYCLFGEPWWLDVVAGEGGWDEVQVEAGGELQARLPFVIRKSRFGITTLCMPSHTQTLGPWFRPVERKQTTELAVQKDFVAKLLGQLPKHDMFLQNFHHKVTNWLPWYWHGYSQTTRYTYQMHDLACEAKIWAGMQSNIRREIRKADVRSIVSVRTDLGFDVLFQICQKTFERQGLPGLNEYVVRRIYEGCEKRKAGQAFFAVDEFERVHAVAYLVWDARSAYYLLGGGDPELRNSGAHSLLLWDCIKFASTVSAAFDFEGSMIEPVERFFRAFGATQVPYFHISRTNNKFVDAYQNIGYALSTLRS